VTQAKPRFRTIDEYLEYDDGTDTRYELVNGELVEMGAESDLNVLISIFLTVMFSQKIPYYLIRRGTEIFVSSRTVSDRYPDLMVLSEEGQSALEGAKRSAITFDMPVPALVIEVVSPGEPGDKRNYDRDYVEKPKEYAARGIPEFWQIDPTRSVVTVLTLKDGAYQVQRFQGSDRVVSPTFPDLQLTAERILSAGR
jgi:Uma2 family endonuclease